jgi:hypothetical protein
LIINFEKLQWAYERQKKVTKGAEDRPNLYEFNEKKKTIIYFQWFRSYNFFNEALQSRFFAKKMTLVKNDDR